MTGIISVLLVLGGLIFFHELGHFLVARAFGMGVKTFSLGFGPAVFSRKRGKTVYQVAAVPLGGYVSLVGETATAEIPDGFTEAENFSRRPAWQRFLVIAAGSVFNLLLAWLICWGLMWTGGRSHMPPIIGVILDGTPAAESPLRVGDRILSLDGVPIERFDQMPAIVKNFPDKDMLIVARQPDGDLITFSLAPTMIAYDMEDGSIQEGIGLGIRPDEKDLVRERYGFVAAAGEGLVEMRNMVAFTWKAIGDLITRKVSFDNVGGPILIAQVIYKQAEHGLVSLLTITALISVNLGVLNLLPVPVLDGGHLIFLLVEMGGRRPVPARIQEKAMIVGLFLLLGLMLAATFNDLMRLFS